MIEQGTVFGDGIADFKQHFRDDARYGRFDFDFLFGLEGAHGQGPFGDIAALDLDEFQVVAFLFPAGEKDVAGAERDEDDNQNEDLLLHGLTFIDIDSVH